MSKNLRKSGEKKKEYKKEEKRGSYPGFPSDKERPIVPNETFIFIPPRYSRYIE
ncbi:hypothetical protein [Candidatus Methylacidiphilum infernorum]|uniref:hypothetical protein n=1 Tax=Candidatus Methylacidiphilum infernorum TaxID=511746 RepID=UPI00031E860B|nr:hypothetical protein [Candidatus Methylacidiphilum infernorum]